MIFFRYLRLENYDAALRISEQFAPETTNDVLMAQARNSFEHRDFQKAETFLLRARKPDIIVKYYKVI